MALTKITTGIIADGAITSDHLASGAVTHSSLSGITTDNITEGSTNLYYADSLVGTYISGNRDYGNITTTGYIAGPATFTIDPAAVGDNTGTVVIAGNLQVDGTTTTINSTTLEVDDLNITLASGAANAAAADGAGITVDGASATITYDGTNDAWSFNKNVGIGTDSPSQPLHVDLNGTSTSKKYLQLDGNGISGSTIGQTGIGFRPIGAGSNVHASIEGLEDGNGTYKTALTFNINNSNSDTAPVEAMRIDSAGQVGIGTDSPNATLHVASSSAKIAEFERIGNQVFDLTISDVGEGAGQLWFNAQTNDTGFNFRPKSSGGTNTNALYIAPDGDVGINQTNPSTSLHVGDGTDADRGIITIEGAGGEHLIFSETSTHPYGANAFSLRPASGTNFIIQNDGASTPAVLVDASGNVNIGSETSYFSEKLLVNGKTRVAGQLDIALGSGYSNYGTLNHDDSNFIIGMNRVSGNGDIILNPYRNVGIGIDNPGAKLDVSGVFKFFDDVSPEIHLVDSDDNNYSLIGYSDGTMTLSTNHGNEAGGANVMQFLTGGTQRFTIQSNGVAVSNHGQIGFINDTNFINVDQATATRMGFALNGYNAGEIKRIGSSAGGSFRPDQYSTGATAAQYPAHAEYSDENTGVYFPAADKVGLTAGGTTRLETGAMSSSDMAAVKVNNTNNYKAGRFTVYGGAGNAENGGTLHYNGTSRQYRNVVSAHTTAASHRWWNIKTNIQASNFVMYVARVHGYSYGNGGAIVDIYNSGYAHTSTGTFSAVSTKNNGSSSDTLEAYYSSDGYVSFKHTTPNSGYYSGMSFDMSMYSPTGYNFDFQILANNFSTSSANYY